MQRHVDTYECEWKATLDDPARVARFVTFVNAPDKPDPDIVFVQEREQVRPARPDELAVLAGMGTARAGGELVGTEVAVALPWLTSHTAPWGSLHARIRRRRRGSRSAGSTR